MHGASPRSRAVALVTYAGLPELSDDDRLLLEPLSRRGIEGRAVRWDDPRADWRSYAAVVLRSPWDYWRRKAGFVSWLGRLEREGARVLNPVPTLRWNLDKSYLRELEARGVPVVPTEWVDESDPRSLRQVLAARRWSDAVVKPVFSAGGYLTWRVSQDAVTGELRAPSLQEVLRDPHEVTTVSDDARPEAAEDGGTGAQSDGIEAGGAGREEADGTAAAEALWTRTRQAGSLMVQPFLPEILEDGEWSFVYLDGELSHALVKRARSGEFRVQNEYGGTIHRVTPGDSGILAAERVLRAARECGVGTPLYARVDMVRTRQGWLLGELELLEPALYLGWGEGAAERFAAALASSL